MSNFIVTFSSKEKRLYARQLKLEAIAKSQFGDPSSRINLDWVCAASFRRKNGSGSVITSDPGTGSWLLSSGLWFYSDSLAAGDESRLLSKYLDTGAEGLGRQLEGSFVIIIADGRTQELIVITDITGTQHSYIRRLEDSIVFSNSSLILAGLDNYTLDPAGCQEFLYTGVIYEDRTFFREVKRLEPARIYRFSKGNLKNVERYWHILNLAPDSLRGKSAVIGLGEALCNAVRKISKVSSRPVCDLTGGYDSRAVFSAFLTSGIKPATFVSGSSESADVTVSRNITNIFNVPHIHFTCKEPVSFEQAASAFYCTDGEYDIIDYSKVLQGHLLTLEKGCDVSVIGSFGEVARGYWWELLLPHTGDCQELDARKLSRLRYAAHDFDPSLFAFEERLDLVSHFAGIIRRVNSDLKDFPNTFQMDNAYLYMRMRCWYGKIASSTERLRPCVSPFQFRSVLETVLQTDWHLRRGNRLITGMLAEFQPRLAKVPLEGGYPAQPLKWNNFYRFWPMLKGYGRRGISKVRRALTGKKTSETFFQRSSPRLQLWQDEKVKAIMHPSKMGIRSLTDAEATSNFLKSSRNKNFAYDAQWNRLLSLEYCLHVLKAMK